MHVLVLGAGVIGVASAWYLGKAGHEVTLVDRHDAAGLETSFANGGQISVSHAQPWANPRVPRKILQWLGREEAPLLFRPRADLAQWLWGLAFLRECTPARTAHNIRQLVTLGLYSRTSLQELRAETGIQYDHLARGILHFYTSERELGYAVESARVMREHGCDLEMVSAAAGLNREGWAGAIDEMVSYGLKVSAQEKDMLLDYLATALGPDAKACRCNYPPTHAPIRQAAPRPRSSLWLCPAEARHRSSVERSTLLPSATRVADGLRYRFPSPEFGHTSPSPRDRTFPAESVR